MLALLPARLPGSYNLCCSAALSICHFALAIHLHTEEMLLCVKDFPKGTGTQANEWASHAVFSLSLPYTLHILPSGAAVPVETTPGLVKFC